MEVHTFLLQLVIILLAARVIGEAAAYIKIPPVIGELCAGIIIGPSILGLIEITTPIYLLAQVGIILLLFEVGIETDISQLAAAGMKLLTVAIGGVIMPFIFAFPLCYYVFDLSLLISLFIGCALTATSIGITLRVLRDLNKQKSNEAQIIIGAALLDDIIGIILLSMLYEFSTAGSINLWNTGKVVFFIVLFFLLAPLAAKIVLLVVKKWDEKSKIPGLLPTIIVSLILFFAWLAHLLGAPELLGGFAAGLALSRQFFLPFITRKPQSHEFIQRVEFQMRPIVHLFTPIFFVAIGLSLNFRDVNWHSTFVWTLSGALIIVAILGKVLSGFLLTGRNQISKFIIGTAMVPRGEIGLIFATIGLNVGVLKNDVYATIIIVIAITTLLAPFSLKWLFTKSEKF